MTDISRNYASLWRGTPRALGFLLSSLPFVVIGFAVTMIGISLGIGLTLVWVGLPIVVGTMMIARWSGAVELTRLRAAGERVGTSPAIGMDGRRIRSQLVDRRNWVYLLHSVVNLVVGLITWTISVSWVTIGIGGVTYGLWGPFADRTADALWVHVRVVELLPWLSPATDQLALIALETVVQAVIGLVALGTLPLVARTLVWVHARIARAMLTVEDASVTRGGSASLATERMASIPVR